MALTKRKFVDQINCEPETGNITWREVVLIEDTEEDHPVKYHRGSSNILDADPVGMPNVVSEFKQKLDTPARRVKAQAIRDANAARAA